MNLLSIDPGYSKSGRGCACAAFRDGILAAHWFERPEQFGYHVGGMCWLDVILWERPQCDGRTWHVPPDVLIQLTAAGAELAGLYAGATGARLVSQTPTGSKGSVPKPIAHMRLLEALTDAEIAVLGGPPTMRHVREAVERGALDRWRPGKSYYPSTWLMHNILDAVALGAKYLGRLK
jgi:hypothetical protein